MMREDDNGYEVSPATRAFALPSYESSGGPTGPSLLDIAGQFIPGVRQVQQVLGAVGSLFGGGAPAPLEVSPAMRTLYTRGGEFTGTLATMVTPAAGSFSAATLALPGGPGGTLPRTIMKWLQKYAILYGPAVAEAVMQEFIKRRRGGQTTALAKASIDQAYPEVHQVRITRGGRRRMNPANIRALRRALRRVRSFKRVTRKVRGLNPTVRYVKAGYHRKRRKGDLWDVEDQADLFDEAEDLGYDPYFFDEEGE